MPINLRHSLRARLWRRVEQKNIPEYQWELKKILADHAADMVIVFPPGLGWDIQLFQRPQQLARAFARLGALVLYTEPEMLSRPSGFVQREKNLYLCHVPLRVFSAIDRFFIYSLTWNQKYLNQLPKQPIIYDFVDDLSAFAGNQEKLARQHQKLTRQAHIVLATAERLRQQIELSRPDAVLCPNGVDYAHFEITRQPRSGRPPADLDPILRSGRPVIGYTGAIARWFDFDLLYKVAAARSDLFFVLIGPDHDHSLPPDFIRLPNLTWLGRKSYAELPEYIRYFDVAMIPFVLNSITHATSPLKLFEYMASHRPIVITPMQESLRYPGVLSAATSEEFSQKLDEALHLRTDPVYLERIDQVALENTWEARARQILDLL
jgi:hypothetical protein